MFSKIIEAWQKPREFILHVHMHNQKQVKHLSGDNSADGVTIIIEGINFLLSTGHEPERVSNLLIQMANDMQENVTPAEPRFNEDNIIEFPNLDDKPPRRDN